MRITGFNGIREKIRSERGSSLVMVLFISFILASLGIVFMSATLGSYRMSILSGNMRQANFVAEAGVEQIANILDNDVFAIQEEAREETASDIFALLENEKALLEGGFLDEEGNIDYAAIDNEFTERYEARFNLKLYDRYTGINDKKGSLYGQDAGNAILTIACGEGDGKAEILGAELHDYELTVEVKGRYKECVSKTHRVTFNLLGTPIVEHYRPVEKIRFHSIEVPDILKKALITEKDLIVAQGTLNITGDVLAFGTVPEDTDKPGSEDRDAGWQKYGGIVAGIPVEADTADSFLDGGTLARTGVEKTGAINISGDAATMSYIHVMLGNSDSDTSSIHIAGNAYARSIRSEADAFCSDMTFDGDVYVMDNLQIDSDESTVDVNGAYYGFVTAGYDIDGSGGGTDETYEFKKTSSIVVNGNSMLYLNGTSDGGVYIGGTSFLHTYVRDSRPYMLGISASMSNWNLIEAYRKAAGFLRYELRDGVYTGVPAGDDDFATYSGEYGSADLMEKKDGASLNKRDRGFHLKGYWLDKWEADPYYPLDTSRIVIDTGAEDRIYGFLNGALVARKSTRDEGEVFNPFEVYKSGTGEVMGDVDFKAVQDGAKLAYYNAVRLLIPQFFDNPRNIKLDYAANTRSVIDYTDNTMRDVAGIIGGSLICSNSGDIGITRDGAEWSIEDLDTHDAMVIPDRGIIVCGGDVYIENGFKFNGVILAKGNVVFYGEGVSEITYDGGVVEALLSNDNNPSARFLFGLYKYEGISEAPVDTQRILTRNISIKQWQAR